MKKDLIMSLNELSKRIINRGGAIEDLAEQYTYFVEHSDAGMDCKFARKARDLFLKHNYDAVKEEFLKTLEQFRIIEGKDFGNGNT